MTLDVNPHAKPKKKGDKPKKHRTQKLSEIRSLLGKIIYLREGWNVLLVARLRFSKGSRLGDGLGVLLLLVARKRGRGGGTGQKVPGPGFWVIF